MPITVGNQYVVTGTRGSATDMFVAPDANVPLAQWVPSVFFRRSITLPARGAEDAQDQAWADLAAHARARWARENPF